MQEWARRAFKTVTITEDRAALRTCSGPQEADEAGCQRGPWSSRERQGWFLMRPTIGRPLRRVLNQLNACQVCRG